MQGEEPTATENPSLRWGLICTANINRALIPAIRASKRSELAAVASRDLARAQDYAREWDIPHVHGSYQALLDDPDVDVIYNALPNALHCEWTVKAADAGKHVLCEKPLAVSVKEVDRIIQASERNRVVILEAFMYRYHPQTLKVQGLVHEGAIGDLRLVRAVFSFPLEPAEGGMPPMLLDPDLGGGSLWDVGCYPVSFAQALTGGDPVAVFGWQVLGDTGVDLTFAGQMRFAYDVLAQFDSSFQAPLRWEAEVVGSQGSLRLGEPWRHQPEKPAVICLRRGDQEETLAVEDVNAYWCEVEAMADRILEGVQSPYSLSDSRGNVATICALRESAQQGKPVSLAR
jgi:xylose dehydrogenase (NAD/NADP)